MGAERGDRDLHPVGERQRAEKTGELRFAVGAVLNEASLPPDVELRAGWDACMASVRRPAAQERIKVLLEQGLEEPGDLQHRLGFHLGQLGRDGER
jgi:hypothetical protein